jgi:hypothetical protein
VTFEYICNSSHRLNYVPSGLQRACAMWRMSSAQALIFIAAVVIAVALLVWIGL